MKAVYLYFIAGMAAAAMGAQAQQGHSDEDGHGHAATKAAETGHDGHDEHEEGLIKLSPEVLEEFGVELDTARSGTIAFTTTLPGEIQINQDRLAHVVPRYPGLVLEVRKKIGDTVARGEVLAILEGNDSLTPFPLKSMIDGTVIDKHITLGESLQPDSVVYTIADLDDVWVNLTLYQKDLLLVRKGQPVTVTGGAHLPTAQGVIDYVSPTMDEHTRTGSARVVLPNPDGAWKPGMFVLGAVFLGEEAAGVVVPATAIQTLEDGASVFVETAEGFEPRPVRLGRMNRLQVEILSGLRAGERYVARGGFTLKAELGRGEMDEGHAH
jgi:cobalt-zinc-cadmium efflux system membrane fusion protein